VEQQPTKVAMQQQWLQSMGKSTVTATQCDQQEQQLKIILKSNNQPITVLMATTTAVALVALQCSRK